MPPAAHQQRTTTRRSSAPDVRPINTVANRIPMSLTYDSFDVSAQASCYTEGFQLQSPGVSRSSVSCEAPPWVHWSKDKICTPMGFHMLGGGCEYSVKPPW